MSLIKSTPGIRNDWPCISRIPVEMIGEFIIEELRDPDNSLKTLEQALADIADEFNDNYDMTTSTLSAWDILSVLAYCVENVHKPRPSNDTTK